MPSPRLRMPALPILLGVGVLLLAAVVAAVTGSARAGHVHARVVAAHPRSAHGHGAGHGEGRGHAAVGWTIHDPAHCRGLVALTFDDGPSPRVTPGLVRLLTRLRVPATFFMVGERVAASPSTARRVARAGFTVGNHTWAHGDLAVESAASERRALLRTQRALRHAGIANSGLMRPPYGALNPRALGVIRSVGLTPVLWTIDSRDWQSGTSAQIAQRILAALRPGPHNIVLQHDGVDRSPLSVAALPRVIHFARQRGYCFVGLNRHGRPAWPTGYHTSPGAR